MSSAETSTVPLPPKDNTQQPPELRIFSRVTSIPLISSSLSTINDTLAGNTYTASPYGTIKGLSLTAYSYTTPLQNTFAPILTRADGLANAAVDAVESRYPYPFQAKPEEVADYVRSRRESASEYVRNSRESANKIVDERVRTPVYSTAKGIDSRFAPLVDYIETTINTRTGVEAKSPSDKEFQYQRALGLSQSIAGNLKVYSSEQLKQLQAQSVLIQKAQDTANAIQNLASSSYTTASTKIHSLSDSMLVELQKLQASTASYSTQAADTTKGTYESLSKGLGETVSSLHSIVVEKDLPVQEKVKKVGQEVTDRISPLLERIKKTASDVVSKEKAVVKENGVH